MLSNEEARFAVRYGWSDRKLRRYLRVAGRLWPDHRLVKIARQENARRQEHR